MQVLGFTALSLIFAILPTSSVHITDVIFICTPVALDTIFEISDALLKMLISNARWRVCMAAIAGVVSIVVPNMAGHAASGMVSV